MGLRAEEIKFLNQAIEEVRREMATLPDECGGEKRPAMLNLEDAFVFTRDILTMLITRNKIDRLFEKLDNLLGGSHDAETN